MPSEAIEMPRPRDPLVIDALGVQGDGIARVDGQARFVAFALPGETVALRPDGSVEVLANPSPDRQAAPCPHFTVCGGCLAQHMSQPLYARWKTEIVRDAFAARGIGDVPLRPLVTCAAGSRRRAVLSAVRAGGRAQLGYHARRSHDLVDVTTCLVLDPAIATALPALRALVDALGVDEARLTVLATTTGLDIAVAAKVKRLTPSMAAQLGRIAAQAHWARVSLNDDPVVARASPALEMGGIAVTPPPGAFTQAVAEAEDAMRRLVTEAASNAKRVLDLFCGVGAFALACARKGRVTAVDTDKPALAALAAAWRHAPGLKPIEALPRDLFRDPFSPLELKDFDAVVLDPPRAGAEAQVSALSKSDVTVIAYVSCNPGTLARDTRVLLDGGYSIEAVTPIDQFLFTSHVEAVAIFRKAARKKRR